MARIYCILIIFFNKFFFIILVLKYTQIRPDINRSFVVVKKSLKHQNLIRKINFYLKYTTFSNRLTKIKLLLLC